MQSPAVLAGLFICCALLRNAQSRQFSSDLVKRCDDLVGRRQEEARIARNVQ
jgi:hypothetical protein